MHDIKNVHHGLIQIISFITCLHEYFLFVSGKFDPKFHHPDGLLYIENEVPHKKVGSKMK